MKAAIHTGGYMIRLDREELLVEQLTDFVASQHITAGWLDIIGGAMWAELGFYELTAQKYHWTKVDGLLEIVCLQGNVAWQHDRPVLHIHGMFSDGSFKTYGGHVKEVQIAGTCEILISVFDTVFHRAHDDVTGLNHLDI